MHDTDERKHGLARVLLLAAAICTVLASFLFFSQNPAETLKLYLDQGVHPLLFVLLMGVLPIIGAPISIFLVLVGIKFGIAAGLLITAMLMFIHMSLTYYLARSFLHKWLTALLRLFNLTLPAFVGRLSKRSALLFMLIPGIPYVVKNNILALSTLGFTWYMLINWTAQFTMSIPMVILGRAAVDMNLGVLAAALILLLVVFLLQRLVRRRHPQSPPR